MDSSLRASRNDRILSENWAGVLLNPPSYGFYTNVTARFTGGIDLFLSPTGVPQYKPWYEFYPLNTVDFDLDINPGNKVQVDITTSTAVKGTITITNLSTRKSVHQVVYAPKGNSLCRKYAGWIVEDQPSSKGGLDPLNNFGTVTFTDIAAHLNTGATKDLTQSNTVFSMLQDTSPVRTLADVQFKGDKSFSVTLSAHP
ncbi:hypothetical protein ACEQ8H_004373 [Pleosporales sp. CAS-2024a]